MAELGESHRSFKPYGKLAFTALVVVAFAPSWIVAFTAAPRAFLIEPAGQATTAGPAESPIFEDRLVYNYRLTRFAHSPTLTETTNGNLLLVWFGGAGEASPSVGLYQSTYRPQVGVWTRPRLVTDREETQAELGRYVFTIGNPALWTAPEGDIYLFYVTSWVAGWSGSSIHLKISHDDGNTWTPARRLVTSPFFNSGTLVRNTPFAYTDGTIGIPAYHELLGVFPEILRVGRQGTALGKNRIDYGKRALQPSIVVLDENRALALLRPRPNETRPPNVLRAETTDAGRSWSRPLPLDLLNPGSSVVGLRLADGSILAVTNLSATSRNDLSLARSLDLGESWEIVTAIEHSERGEQFAYPALLQATDGRIHLAYAWNYSRIK
ncbi:MAG TPA: sialidase family protein, partial [Vicinamibacteria bacterium]